MIMCQQNTCLDLLNKGTGCMVMDTIFIGWKCGMNGCDFTISEKYFKYLENEREARLRDTRTE